MINEEEAKKLRDKIFRVRTEEEIDQMLLESVKEMDNPNTKLLTHEESIAHVRRMINDSKKVQNKIF